MTAFVRRSPDVPEANLLVKMSAHDALLGAHDVVAAGAGEHRLHTCTGERQLARARTRRR